MTAPEELSIACASGVTIAARAWGEPTAPRRALALHGWMDNAASWDRLAPALAKDWRVVALDLPGHGRSDSLGPGREYTQVDHAFAAMEALAALGWSPKDPGGPSDEDSPPPVDLLGHSMGGGVACLVAASFPELVRRLVLVEGFGPLSREPSRFVTQMRDALRKRLAYENGLAQPRERLYGSLDEAAGARAAGAKRWPGRQFMSHEAARAIASRAVVAQKEGPTRARKSAVKVAAEQAATESLRFGHDRRLAHPSTHSWHEEQVLAVLSAIACPTLLIQAAHGWPRPEPGYSQRIQAMRPGLLELCELDRGSHYAHLDDDTAGEVRDAVVEFLERADA